MAVTQLANHSSFTQFLAANERVVVDFYAIWCGPCKVIAPKVEDLAKEYTGIKFAKIDVDENIETSEQQDISAMPTFLFFYKGKKVGELVGASEAKLKDKLEELNSV